MATQTEASLADEVVQWFTDPAARQDPYPFFDRLREREPVHFNPTLNAWVLTRLSDGDTIFRGSPVVRSPEGADMAYMRDAHGELCDRDRHASERVEPRHLPHSGGVEQLRAGAGGDRPP